ncbi:hypothetical protein JB92DRAFT_2825685 [Gautieria morchelliformis]|nr:hypothetical protein JB92DRAFT_2825685 [Gautieria morchelliformis]
MVKKSKSNQIPPEWTYIFHKLYAQGVDPRTLLPPTVPAGAGPSPAEETPDISIEAALAPLFPSDTPNLTATSVCAAQPISTVHANYEGENTEPGSESEDGSNSDSDGESGSNTDSSESDSDSAGSGSGSGSNTEPEAPKKKEKVTEVNFTLADIIRRSNNGEVFNVIPKPDGRNGCAIFSHQGPVPVQPPRRQSTRVSKPSKKVREMDENVPSASKTKNK